MARSLGSLGSIRSPLLSFALLATAVAGPLFAGGCAADAPAIGSTADDASGSDELRSAMFDEGDADQTVKVKAGQSILLKLPATPSAGYAWKVTSTNRTFGYPEKEWFRAASDGTGGAGVTTFRWRTDGPLPMVGEHTVTLAYQRAGASAPEKTFTLTFAVEDPAATPAEAVTLTEADDGARVEVEEGKAVVLRLAENATTGYRWSVTSTTRTLGYPTDAYETNPSRETVGGGGTRVFTFRTDGPLSKVGSHGVRLEQERPGSETSRPAATFSATIVVKAKGDGAS